MDSVNFSLQITPGSQQASYKMFKNVLSKPNHDETK